MPPEASLGCDRFLDFSWFWWPWQFWGILSYRTPLRWNLSDFFLLIRWGHWKEEGKCKCHFHHIIRNAYTRHDLWPFVLTLITWQKLFLHSKVTPYLSPYCTLEKEVSTCNPLFRSGKLYFLLFRVEHLQNLFGIFIFLAKNYVSSSSFINLFNHFLK